MAADTVGWLVAVVVGLSVLVAGAGLVGEVSLVLAGGVIMVVSVVLVVKACSGSVFS